MTETVVRPPFGVSPRAVEQIEHVGGSVRIDVETGGCCGQTYTFRAEPPQDGDAVYGCPGAWLAVGPPAAAVLPGARLDYGAALSPPRFRVTGNPNTPLRCPCNRSFGAAWPGRGQPGCRARTPMPWDTRDGGAR